MFGRKTAANQPSGRKRLQAERGSSQVFSYHANRSSSTTGVRNARSTPWSGITPKSASQQRVAASKPWPRRVAAATGVVVLLCFAAYNATLSRDPSVVALTDTKTHRVLLRSQTVYEQAADDVFRDSLLNFSKLSINTDRLAAVLEQRFPELERVSIALPFIGRGPVVYIQPAQPVVLLKAQDGGLYLLDTAGRAIASASQAPKIEQFGLSVIEDQSGLPVTLGKAVLPSKDIAFITEVLGQLAAKKLTITSMVLPKAGSELDVRVAGVPYFVKFNLRGDARVGVGSFLAVKQQLEREGKTPSSYVDVRVDNRAYYR